MPARLTPTRPPLARISRVLAMFLVAARLAGAAEIPDIPAVGPHRPILIVAKNVNPQNKMVVYTKVDADGQFAVDPVAKDRPVLDFYWLMDGRTYKPVNPLIKREIRRRISGEWNAGRRNEVFTVSVSDLKEVKSDLKDPKIEICARETGAGKCVEAQMNLGPSDGDMRIRLSSIYTVGRAFPPAVDSVTLEGEEIVDGRLTGKKVTRTYGAANHPG